ncbi:amidase [Amycolatopsis viridis]|uniref:Aspartyl-tRNA(Asn)/glutamyl-tRNA(Gln) amidotransferase subunit A n=1 Tax=Amycolatopsis viridis TaxID=185678 RepID=A0ABX0SVE6_9PSEU|nr:amidase [Amycolatopsis viridis]NIH79619.1 aspartyl-tRNA(Asn)/glutamyl-tRNA(Gln) amidotransferase subunit A [Amycolatopsis viridis]
MSSSLPTRTAPPAGAGWFAHRSVAGLAADLRAGRLTACDLVAAALAEIERWDPVVNAFVTVDEAGARRAAEQADRELADGVDRGPLHGIPIAVKDLIDVRGLPTTAGSRHFAGAVAADDADCVRRLRAAGAIVLGKTATHEIALGPTGDRAAGGPTRNPHLPSHMAGGSSSGSAAAVAAGMVPLALGTDTGGSVRVPAALCGVVGLKPTHGALSLHGVLPLAPSLDTVGPLARTAADCRLLWTVLSGTRPVSGTTPLAWMAPEQIHPTLPEVTAVVRAGLGDLTEVTEVAEVTVPGVAELREAYPVLQGSEAFAVHAERFAAAPELFGEEVRERLRAGSEVRGWEYVRARELRDRVRADVLGLLRRHGFLALPTVPLPAPPVDARTSAVGDVRAALLSLASPWSVLGLPALSVPAGLAGELPVGLQLVGPPGSEHRLLAIAEQL